jgi:teichuronic acid biosynthesis protein TuaE
MSEPAGPGPVTPHHPRSALADSGVILAGAAVTVVLAAALARRPVQGLALLALFALVAVLAFNRRRVARTRVSALLAAVLVTLPAAALLGPALALPSQPQLSLYRVLLAVVVFLGVTYLIVLRDPLPFAAKDVALPIVLWFAWLFVGLLWAGDKASALNYIAIVVTMMALLFATAACGGTSRRLRAFGYLMIVAYALITGYAVFELVTGIHLPFSKQATVATVQQFNVATSVFVNQNDLATYLSICWPFLLAAFFFTRKVGWLVLDVLFIVLAGPVFLSTGSRSSLIAAGIATIGAVVLYARLGSRLSTRGGKVVGIAAAIAIVALGGFLLFNNSQNPLLNQFRLETLLSQAQSGAGSGAIRSDLTSQGLEIAGHSLLLGAGAGQAEHIIAQGAGALGITNLHNWWLETYADGGLVGFALQAGFFVLLIAALWPIARRSPDPFVRYLAGGTLLALIGFTIGSLGPSSSVGFAPMWVLYGLGLAVVSRARLANTDREARGAAAGTAGLPEAIPVGPESDAPAARETGA